MAPTVDDDSLQISDEELHRLSDALKTLTKLSALEDVKEKLTELKEGRKEFKEVRPCFAMAQGL